MGTIESIRWKERVATQISNDRVRLVGLKGGGHIAHLGFMDHAVSDNLLWEAPWTTVDPSSVNDLAVTQYGDDEARAFLGSYSGHALCLDYFGPPSIQERSLGLSLHGEAALRHWEVQKCDDSNGASCRWTARLPLAKLDFERQITLCDRETTFRVRETVTSRRQAPHSFDWVQHVTFGHPLLENGESTLLVSGSQGLTSPQEYDGRSLIAANREFIWPHVPAACGETQVDLRIPFSTPGRGYIAGVRLDPDREFGHLLAMNWRMGVGVGYIFRRNDFPWMTIWEENRARTTSPWNGTTCARGMEFGTCPLPLGRHNVSRLGSMFGTPNQKTIHPGEQQEARYVIVVFKLPSSPKEISDLVVSQDEITFIDSEATAVVSVPSKGCYSYLAHH